MKCDEAVSQISFLPKGELAFEARQNTLQHLKTCEKCNNEYKDYLRMFYLIDSKPQLDVPELTLENFSSDVMQNIEIKEKSKMKFNRIIWYVAAAILFVITTIIPFYESDSPIKFHQKSENQSISELIQKEDWNTVLQKLEKNDIPEELISVSLLLSKFSEIDVELANNTLTAKFGNKNDFNKLIQMLVDYRRFSDGISVTKIAKYIKTNTGVTS